MEPSFPPLDRPVRPPVIVWFKVYCVILSLLYFACAALGAIWLYVAPEGTKLFSEAMLTGVILTGAGLVFLAATLPPLFLPPRPWVWVYGLVLICLGLTSPCFIPICVPLLLYWIKPEAKAWFGRS